MNKTDILHQYSLIKSFRETHPAPVDSLGSSSIYAQLEGPEDQKKFLLLVSLLLSAQTNDKTTYKVMMDIKHVEFTPAAVLKMSDSDLQDKLKGVNFRKKKAKYIKQLAGVVRAGSLPNSIEDVLKLKGMGAKLGHMYMQTAFDKVEGISVDTHCHR